MALPSPGATSLGETGGLNHIHRKKGLEGANSRDSFADVTMLDGVQRFGISMTLARRAGARRYFNLPRTETATERMEVTGRFRGPGASPLRAQSSQKAMRCPGAWR